ncbi:c-type cytochrome [Litorisediminicola beolgyonensis]|uniref:C-type cytochrome n=1 Tax=Litorisediminicola beolgyonensis TaxID=1173614 RepID=A0ABW3ZI24_9RHOB
MAPSLPTLVSTLALAVTLAAPERARAEALFPYTEPERVAAGEALYAEHCAACHGADLEGQPNWMEQDAEGYLPAPPHDETGHTWHHPDRLLFDIVSQGTEALVGGEYRSRMAGYGDVLTEQEIIDVMAFIKSTWSEPIQRRHDAINGG